MPTLDVEAAIGNPRTFDLGEIAGNIDFIPLDRSIPVGEIGTWHGLEPAARGFYIADARSLSPVQHFDTQGRFVGTVGRIGRGPGETTSVVGVSPNPETGEIYVDGTTDVVGLDPAGNEFARADGFISWGMIWYQDRLLTFPVLPPWNTEDLAGDSIPFIDLYDRDLKLVGNILGPNIGTSVGINGHQSPPLYSFNGERLLIKQGRGDTLYQYGAGEIRPVYALKLGAYVPPAEVFEFIPPPEWDERHFVVDNVWEGERWLIVSANNTHDAKPLIFDRRDIAAGGFSATGPGGEAGLFIGGIRFRPGYMQADRLVGYLQAIDIADNRAAITHPRLKELAATIEEDSNPVIVVVELN